MRWLIGIFIFLFIIHYSPFIIPVHAIYNPLSVPNNKVGIHIISPTPEETSPAADLVNTNGDWGYITVLIESKDRNVNKWQAFFNDLRKRHLIPIVRLATQPDGNIWKRPYEGEEEAWAGFLNNLIWPTKNRYVTIYNEPNHATEWSGTTDPKGYAQVLNKTIDALKKNNPDFFVLNAGFDASAPHKPPDYFDQIYFLKQMEEEIPGIFEKLDGWVSHSYPNPGFIGLPNAGGRGTIKNYLWELDILKSLGVTKNLPVFITETGWKHANGINTDSTLPKPEVVAQYFESAFQTSWSSSRVVAVTPFLLNYQDPPFDHFSFRKYQSNQYHPQYQAIKNLSKIIARPIQENKAQLISGEIYKSIVAGEKYNIYLTFKNTGQSIWNEYEQVSLIATEGGDKLGIDEVVISKEQRIEPGNDYTFAIRLKAPNSGTYQIALNLFNGEKQFESNAYEFTTEVKSPVILKVKANLKWKKDQAGEYLLSVMGVVSRTVGKVILNREGLSEQIEVKYILPDYTFNFTLEKPFYKPKTISQTVLTGENILDFGELQPDIPSAILKPLELWKLLPWSN